MSHTKTTDYPDKIHYNKINYKLRLQLIDKVLKQGSTIKAAAIELGIKQSTAKFIVASYRKKGKIFRRKLQKIQPELIEQVKLSQKITSENLQVIPQYNLGYFVPVSYVFYYPYF